MHTALVTGSTRNIGRSIAVRLAADGAAVVVNGRDQAATEDVAEEIRAAGGRALGWACDVTDSRAVIDMVTGVAQEVAPIDILVNNAVARLHAPLPHTSVEDWRHTLRVILDGAFHCSQAVLPGMRTRGWGRIVNLAGTSGQKGAANRVAVVTAKSGIIGLTKALALEFAPEGITCNAISPGLIDTDRVIPPEQAATAEAHYAEEAAKVPVARLGRPEEVAAACAYLCSDAADFVTGQVLAVNGGLYM